jgi:hypothetical protein
VSGGLVGPGSTVRFIGRCPFKPPRSRASCTFVAAVEVTADAQGLAVLPRENRPGCPIHTAYSFGAKGTVPHPLRWAIVEGRLSERHCDSRCENARGVVCNCSCGGARHGIAWLTQPTQLPLQID